MCVYWPDAQGMGVRSVHMAAPLLLGDGCPHCPAGTKTRGLLLFLIFLLLHQGSDWTDSLVFYSVAASGLYCSDSNCDIDGILSVVLCTALGNEIKLLCKCVYVNYVWSEREVAMLCYRTRPDFQIQSQQHTHTHAQTHMLRSVLVHAVKVWLCEVLHFTEQIKFRCFFLQYLLLL